MLDGANNNDDVIGQRAGSQARTPLEAVAEFQVVTNQYDAEFGRTTGAIIKLKNTGTVTLDNPDRVIPQTDQITAGYERLLWNTISVSADYVHACMRARASSSCCRTSTPDFAQRHHEHFSSSERGSGGSLDPP
jgi:hypothetical protein